jgi:hypothetical protein
MQRQDPQGGGLPPQGISPVMAGGFPPPGTQLQRPFLPANFNLQNQMLSPNFMGMMGNFPMQGQSPRPPFNPQLPDGLPPLGFPQQQQQQQLPWGGNSNTMPMQQRMPPRVHPDYGYGLQHGLFQLNTHQHHLQQQHQAPAPRLPLPPSPLPQLPQQQQQQQQQPIAPAALPLPSPRSVNNETGKLAAVFEVQNLLGTLGTQIVSQTGKMDTVFKVTAHEPRFRAPIPGLATNSLPPLNLPLPQALIPAGGGKDAPSPPILNNISGGGGGSGGAINLPVKRNAGNIEGLPLQQQQQQQYPRMSPLGGGQQQQQQQQLLQGLTPPPNLNNMMSNGGGGGGNMGQLPNGVLPMQQQHHHQFVSPLSAAPLNPLYPTPASLPPIQPTPGTGAAINNNGGNAGGGTNPSPGNIPMMSPSLRSAQVERASDWAIRAKAEYFQALTAHTTLMQNFSLESGREDDAREEMESTMGKMHVMYKEMMAAKKALEAAEFADQRWTVQPPPHHQAGHRIKCSAIKAEMEAGNLDVGFRI